jgi:two-component system sensor histidine kinase BarA
MNPTGKTTEKTVPLILVIDDDSSHARLLQVLAETLNVRVHAVLSCKEAMAVLDQAKFDLILMDWRMPEVNGCACTRQVRVWGEKHNVRLPIIAVSAYNSEAHVQACLDSGMDDFLAKPFTLEQLQETLRRWQPERRPPPPDVVADS